MRKENRSGRENRGFSPRPISPSCVGLSILLTSFLNIYERSASNLSTSNNEQSLDEQETLKFRLDGLKEQQLCKTNSLCL